MPSRWGFRERLHIGGGHHHGRRPSHASDKSGHSSVLGHPPQIENEVNAKGGPVEGTSGDDEESPTTIHNALWRKAYGNLKEGPQTAKYIEEYEKLVDTVFLAKDNDGKKDSASPAISMEESRLRLIVEQGLKKIEKSKSIIERSAKINDAITPVRNILDIPMKNLTQTALPWAVVTSSLDLLMKPTKSMATLYNGVNQINSRIHWYSKITDRLLSRESNTASLAQIRELLDTKVLDLYQSPLFYQVKSVCFYYRNQFFGFLRALVELDDWEGDLSAIADLEQKLRDDLQPYKQEQILSEIRQLSTLVQSQANIAEDRQCKKDLRGIDPRAAIQNIEERREKSIRELYEWVLDTEEYRSFLDWADPHSPNLLWINGQAGTGKTMLSVGLIQELLARSVSDVHGPEILYFLIQDTGKGFNDGAAVLRGLMWLLLVQNPDLVRYLRPKYQDSGAALFNDPMAFTNLLPIFTAMVQDADLGRIVIFIDALDECEGAGEDVFRVVRKLLPADGTASKVKILLTSRPLREISDEIEMVSVSSKAIIKLDEEPLLGAIDMYIDRKRHDFERKTRKIDLVDRVINTLKEKAGRTFIWVSLVCKELISSPEYAWMRTLERAPKELHDLYGFLLERLNDPYRACQFDYCKDVLVLIMLACQPLKLCEIEVLAKLPEDSVEAVVQDCRSFVTVQQDTVYFIHQSAQDYLRENHAALREGSLEDLHHGAFERSVHAMDGHLERNMYKLPNHGVFVEEVQVPLSGRLDPLRYACQYWTYHLKRGGLQESDSEIIYQFLYRHFLHWLEAASLLRVIPHAMDAINTLHSLLKGDGSDELPQFLRDGRRFIMKFGSVIAQAPLQAYVSALAFAPEESKVKEIFRSEIPRWVPRVQPLAKGWGALLYTIQGKRKDYVAVSPDGCLMATGSDNSVEVWDLATGTLVQSLGGSRYYSVDFSPCGQLLAAGLDDARTVKLWDTVKWRERQVLQHPSAGRLPFVICAFSPRGGVLASASENTLCLWDLPTSSIKWSTTDICSFALAFSPDGQLVASCHRSKVYLYNTDSGRLEQTLESALFPGRDQIGFIDNVTFSSNSPLVAVCNVEGVRVWNTMTWRLEWARNQERRCGIAFSPNDPLLAIGTKDVTIEMWNTKTWTLIRTLPCSLYVNDLAFSPDGQVLLSALWPDGISLWDISPHMLHQEQEEEEHSPSTHLNFVKEVVFSPTGHHVASFAEGKIAVWDPRTGNTLYTHEVNDDWRDLVFSPDGKWLCTSQSNSLTVWDARTGVSEREIKVLGSFFTGLKFEETSDGGWVCTNCHNIRVPIQVDAPLQSQPKEAIKYDQADGWISRADGTERLIWVPYEFRPLGDTYTIHAETFVSGNPSGQVSFISFQLEDTPSR
ncbi:WD40 repeat-like protein [Aspergillus heteromorphus CBS 117.55]|uniref:WD40 repeat-like protein n=1 Tax=Aspergillus heteromorphus CBS 117.55 TaxID=1448321 RepID=A0A317X6X2_9EURO|nr:WD40 repeat-like protein [Aspergillus heteromorphus CBS 117.55]PWY92330.1 WD40 repeat-like protein [Aspergillus heteromorphus CBS 117.55]